MSYELYKRVVWWNGEKGLIKEIDVTVELEKVPPFIAGIAEVDFGEIELGKPVFARVREDVETRHRDMEAPEIAALRQWLASIRSAVRVAMRKKR